MDFLEKDLEDILFESDQEDIRKRGLGYFSYNKLYRQVRLGNYGIADLISFKRYGKSSRIIVYELKNRLLDSAAFWQTVRYMKGIDHHMARNRLKFKNCEIVGEMVGREIDLKSDFCYFPAIQSKISMYTYGYKVDGITFEYQQDSFTLNNPGEISLNSLGYTTKRDFLRDLVQEPLNIKELPF